MEENIMLKLIVGLKGSGKTKTLIELANKALEETNGSVVCIEKGSKLIYDIKPQVRLIDTDNFGIADAQSLYGFVAGILASNHDVTDLFIDSALKICKNDVPAFADMIDKLNELAGLNMVITSSIAKEDLPENTTKYVIN